MERLTMSRKRPARPVWEEKVPKTAARQLTQRDIDTSSHRLSAVINKFSINKEMGNEKSGPFAENFFKSHPDLEMDFREPKAKIEDADKTLSDSNIDPNQRLTTLLHKKANVYIVYGENSPESARVHLELGAYYNQYGRPQSAIRHLVKAHQLEETQKLTDQESIAIAVETAEAHLSLYYKGKQAKADDSQKHFQDAAEAIQRVSNSTVEDRTMRYRRDVSLARVTHGRGDFATALRQYDTALGSFREMSGGQQDEKLAFLFVEMAQNASALKNKGETVDEDHNPQMFYKKAYDIFISLQMEKEAIKIEPFLPEEESVSKPAQNEAKPATEAKN